MAEVECKDRRFRQEGKQDVRGSQQLFVLVLAYYCIESCYCASIVMAQPDMHTRKALCSNISPRAP